MTGKYQIRKAFWHKNFVMLLSVVSTLTGVSAMWSTHEHTWEHEDKPSIDLLASVFQLSHDEQIDKMIEQEFLNEPEEFRHKTVEDITEATKNMTF